MPSAIRAPVSSSSYARNSKDHIWARHFSVGCDKKFLLRIRDVNDKMHKPVNEMPVNGYPNVRRWQRRGAEHRGQCSLTANHRTVMELASGAHGKLWGKDVINLVKSDRRKVVYSG